MPEALDMLKTRLLSTCHHDIVHFLLPTPPVRSPLQRFSIVGHLNGDPLSLRESYRDDGGFRDQG
jgi:hypothetical protein